jgi:8-oxo-dGTP pyrophosphatase MutT (NUDIX family)
MTTLARDPSLGWHDSGVDIPDFLVPLARSVHGVPAESLTRFTPPDDATRRAAVLALFGVGEAGPDLLICERAHTMRSHAGQPAFPGGAVDDSDADEIAAALREAQEETGLDPAGVTVFGALPDLWVPVSGFVVSPMLGWWHDPVPVRPVDAAEVASVHRVPITELAEPARRLRVRHPSGYVGFGFDVRDLLIWGFTAGLINGLLDMGGWSQPWDDTRIVDLPQ